MSDSLPELKTRVDEQTYLLLAAVAKAAHALKIPWLVTGAAARVILLETVYGLPHGRGTEDVDFGVMVESWDRYRTLVERICQDPDFRQDPKQRQRLQHAKGGYLDIVPFGGVESENHSIRWPPDDDFIMSVTGFQDAYTDAVQVSVRDLTVPIVSPIGLMLLKLVAWKERHHIEPKRDAADIAYVLRHFSTLLTEKVLFDEHFDAVEAASYDPDLAASRVLGQKVAKIASKDTREYVRELLEHELEAGTDSRLIRELAHYLAGAGERRAYELLQNLKRGFDASA